MPVLFLDFETTGLNIYHDDIIEYSIREKDTGLSVSSLVKLDKQDKVSNFITGLTGISNEMLVDGQTPQEAVTSMVNFIDAHSSRKEKATLVAHNGDSFDFLLLKKLMNKHSVHPRYNLQYLDTLRFVQKLTSRFYRYNQPNLCKIFKIKNNAEHRASGDTESLEEVYNNLAKMYSTKKSTINDHIKYTYDCIK